VRHVGGATGAGVEDVAAVELGGDVALGQLPRQGVGRVGVVVGQRVAGAASKGGGTEGDEKWTPLGVALLDLDFLDVGGPLGVLLEIGRDGEAALRRRCYRDVLCGLIGHGAWS